MPHYDYICSACNQQTEVFQKITDQPLKECSNCQKPALQRKPGGGIGLIFQGSGFYITDYDSGRQEQKSESKSSSDCCPCGKNSGGCSTKSE